LRSMEFRDGIYKTITYIFDVILENIHFKLTSLDVILRQFKFEIAKSEITSFITNIFDVILENIHFKLTSLDVILRQFKFEIAKF
jgi:hypothetical protein